MSDTAVIISMGMLGLASISSLVAWAFHTGATHNAVKSLELRMDRMETKIDKIVDKLID
tara:strand:+ start:2159 stop:2335 length:177 start_codon:yes stop_codon:yes gene_type:complete